VSATGLLVLTSLLFFAGMSLGVSGWQQPRPSLERSARYLRRPAPLPAGRAAAPLTIRLGDLALQTEIGERAMQWRQPLRLIGRTVPTHVGLLILAAVGGLIGPALAVGMLSTIGLLSISVFVPLGLSLLGLVAAPFAVHSDAISRSDEVRIDIRHQLSAYLDMVTMLLAGNTGHEGALQQAARAGDGLLFTELRRRMREVGATGNSLVGALAIVGEDFGVVELTQVAAAAQLSAAEGAPVARTLTAKCSTLRSTLAAEEEANARVRNDKVTPPLVGMAVLFMALIIYPALNL
jgi:tight adherence protein C